MNKRNAWTRSVVQNSWSAKKNDLAQSMLNFNEICNNFENWELQKSRTNVAVWNWLGWRSALSLVSKQSCPYSVLSRPRGLGYSCLSCCSFLAGLCIELQGGKTRKDFQSLQDGGQSFLHAAPMVNRMLWKRQQSQNLLGAKSDEKWEWILQPVF